MYKCKTGLDFVAVGFADDGRAMAAVTCSSKEDAIRWIKTNQELKWKIYYSHNFMLTQYNEQVIIE